MVPNDNITLLQLFPYAQKKLFVGAVVEYLFSDKEVAWTHSEIDSMLSCPRNATQGAYSDKTKNGQYAIE